MQPRYPEEREVQEDRKGAMPTAEKNNTFKLTRYTGKSNKKWGVNKYRPNPRPKNKASRACARAGCIEHNHPFSGFNTTKKRTGGISAQNATDMSLRSAAGYQNRSPQGEGRREQR